MALPVKVLKREVHLVQLLQLNSHAFHGEKADNVLQNFLINSEKLAVIIDPPLGAKTELIWESLARLKQRAEMLSCSVTISYIWVFLTSWRSRFAGKLSFV